MANLKVFVICLERSQDRRNYMQKQLKSHGIDFEFIDAVDGYAQPPHPLFSDYDYAKRLWLTSGKMPSPGEMGCYASHYLAWTKCLALNTPVIVFEDDIELSVDASKIIDIVSKKIEQYGFLRLENPRGGRLKKVEDFEGSEISAMEDNFGGAQAYAISPNAAHLLLKHRWSMPVDNFIGATYIHGMVSYLLSPSIMVDGANFETTIQHHKSAYNFAFYRKPSRELYTLYKKIRKKIFFNRRFK